MSTTTQQGFEAIGILAPKIENSAAFQARYEGLVTELGKNGLLAVFTFRGEEGYDWARHFYSQTSTLFGEALELEESPMVVRNLRLVYDGLPIYEDPLAPVLVHNTEFNRFMSRKDKVAELLRAIHPVTIVANPSELVEAAAAIPGDKVVIKPVTGLRSRGVQVIRKVDISRLESPTDNQLVQEYIDTSSGDPQLGIEGVHNLRVLSIDSSSVGAVGRIGGTAHDILAHDDYGSVYLPEDIPIEAQELVAEVHDAFRQLPGNGRNVIAIDLMFGGSQAREQGYVICEVNERPMRISPNTVKDPDTVQDPNGLLWLAKEWDDKEAKLLKNVLWLQKEKIA